MNGIFLLMQRLFIMRHGETDWNVEGRLQGVQDIPLNANGRDQATEGARLFREFMKEPFSVAASPLQRAKATAASFGQCVYVWPSLLERDFGVLEGQGAEAIEELALRDQEVDEAWHQERGIETLTAMRTRAHCVVSIVKKSDCHWLLISHGRFIRMLLSQFRGIESRGLRNTEWMELPLGEFYG
jgi:broad specificity phosphatase PhoE